MTLTACEASRQYQHALEARRRTRTEHAADVSFLSELDAADDERACCLTQLIDVLVRDTLDRMWTA